MTGTNLFLDTNAFIYFFEGRPKMGTLVSRTPILYFSPVTQIELLSARHLAESELRQIQSFLMLCQSVNLDHQIVDQAILLRRTYSLKTPDAIVAGSAMMLGVPLVSADQSLQRVHGLSLISDIL
ncbi:MAG TPA: type II toxin-antitoxin system VapC family toxin [Caldilineaceae bacterium]|nr:type II toxin-antitoxin system VapC family toxin [Caldilineaceae bacterium]